MVTKTDLSSNFFLTENDVDKSTRIQACINSLKTLNPYCYVEEAEIENNESLFNGTFLNISKLKNFLTQKRISCVFVGDIKYLNYEFLSELNVLCRTNIIGYIIGINFGIACSVFSDFGLNHEVVNMGHENKNGMVLEVKMENSKLLIKVFGLHFKYNNYFKFFTSETKEMRQLSYIKFRLTDKEDLNDLKMYKFLYI